LLLLPENITALGSIVSSVSEKRPQSLYEKNLLYFCRLILRIVGGDRGYYFFIEYCHKRHGWYFLIFFFLRSFNCQYLAPRRSHRGDFGPFARILKRLGNVVVNVWQLLKDLGNIEILCTDKPEP